MQIDAGGGPVVAIATPFDKDLEAINSKICADHPRLRRRGEEGQGTPSWPRRRRSSRGKPPPAGPSSYARGGLGATYDFLQQIKDGKVKLREVKEAELPKELQGKSDKEKTEILDKLDKERQELSKKARAGSEARRLHRREAEGGRQAPPADSFENQVLGILRVAGPRPHRVRGARGGKEEVKSDYRIRKASHARLSSFK